MSLETVIAENTTALRELLSVLKAGSPAIQPEASSTEKKSDKSRSSAPTQTASDSSANSSTGSTGAGAPGKGTDPGNAQQDAAAQTDASAATNTTAQSAPTGDVPTYQQTADAVTKLAKVKGRDAAVGVLKQFGAAKLPDVKPEQFGAVVAACAAAMEG